MSLRTNRWVLIPVIILVPILLGMPPLSFVYKIASGCPLNKGKQGLNCGVGYFHSLVSPDHPILLSLSQTPNDRGGVSSFQSHSIHNNFTRVLLALDFPPLRC
jgi:hypothetical protein